MLMHANTANNANSDLSILVDLGNRRQDYRFIHEKNLWLL